MNSVIISTKKGVEQRKAAITCLYELYEVQNKRAVAGYFHEGIGKSGNKRELFILFRTRYFEESQGDKVQVCGSCDTVKYIFKKSDIIPIGKSESWIKKANKVVMKHYKREEEFNVFIRYDLKDK
jgi:hypothetical protein